MPRRIRQLAAREMADMAILYADPRGSFGHRDAEERYDISESTFRLAMDKVVIENKVEDEIVRQMEEKALYNVREKVGEVAEHRVRIHYAELRKKREEYDVNEEKKFMLATTYANDDRNKERFCYDMAIARSFFDKVIMSVIFDERLPEDIFDKLRKKGLKNNWSRKALQFWDKVSQERKSRIGRG